MVLKVPASGIHEPGVFYKLYCGDSSGILHKWDHFSGIVINEELCMDISFG